MLSTSDIARVAREAVSAQRELARANPLARDTALLQAAQLLEEHAQEVLDANLSDLARARATGALSSTIDRLRLDEKRVSSMAATLRSLAVMRDPVGTVVEGWTRPNGLRVSRVRVPLGLVGVIYEGRPNVTVDAAGLAVRSGNAVVLRGSSTAQDSNRVLADLLSEGLSKAGLPPRAVGLVADTSREGAVEFLRLEELDCLIPRGGPSLLQSVAEHARAPVVLDGAGNCHVYVDAAADLEMAVRIVVNAKCSRPSVCNAAETLLVHSKVAERFLPAVAPALEGVELRADERASRLLPGSVGATEADWETEYLDLVLAVRVVDSLDEAIDHVARYSTGHSEAIVTEDLSAARRFTTEVDAAAVLVNASTRFVDGGELGLGAEIGISTQKLHVRGPMGAEALTCVKLVIEGEGQVR